MLEKVNIGLFLQAKSHTYEVWCSTVVSVSKTLACFNGVAFQQLPFSIAIQKKLTSFFQSYFFCQFPFTIEVQSEPFVETCPSFSCKPNLSDIENELIHNLINFVLNEK